jgi:serpin B
MKDLNEYTEEVMRRAEEKRAKKKRARSRALAVGLPCLAAVLCAGAFLMSRLGKPADNKEANAPAYTEPAPTEAQPAATNRIARGTTDLMKGVTARGVYEPRTPSAEVISKEADFALRLFKACYDGNGNCLVSPLSVLAALSMTANGAEGDTLAEMEAVLGMSRAELNEFYADYLALLPSMEGAKLELANSIWFTSDPHFAVNRDFLQTNADYFGAEICSADFDEQTLKDINGWVNDKTEGMIPEIIDKLPDRLVMCLINALAFDAEWEHQFKNPVPDREFTTENGEKRTVTMMHADGQTYISGEHAEGFIKYYKGGKYAFAALLPEEGMSVSELVASLDAKSLLAMLSGAEENAAKIGLPKFESEYSTSLNDALSALGMPLAFDENRADFSGLGVCAGENIYIGKVLHKTFISVDELGTKAAAVTSVWFVETGINMPDHTVILDRPFVYMLIDTETNLPFFIGTLMDPQA